MSDIPQATTAEPLYRKATQAAWLGLIVNLTLGTVKLVGGVWGQSFALISDSVNSFGDVLASVVALLGLRVAQRPADEEHPYGHSRAEAIAGSNIGLLIILSALWVGWEAVRRLGAEHALPPLWTLWIAAANVLIKESLYRYKRRVGKRIGSSAILANAWDHRSDAFCSLAVLIGLALVRSGVWIGADEVAALVVVAAILVSGFFLFRNSCSELMDLQAPDELLDRIRSQAQQVEGVCAVEKLWVRKSGLEYFVDIHIQVDARMTVEQGHQIGHHVKDQLVAGFPAVRDVLVHLEPFPHLHRPVRLGEETRREE